MKVLFFAVLTLFIGIQFSTQATENNPLRIVHYNIKELHSLKIHSQLGASNLNQLQAVRNILLRLRPELLSLNEVQYDLPGVPDSSFVTTTATSTQEPNFPIPSTRAIGLPTCAGFKYDYNQNCMLNN